MGSLSAVDKCGNSYNSIFNCSNLDNPLEISPDCLNTRQSGRFLTFHQEIVPKFHYTTPQQVLSSTFFKKNAQKFFPKFVQNAQKQKKITKIQDFLCKMHKIHICISKITKKDDYFINFLLIFLMFLLLILYFSVL